MCMRSSRVVVVVEGGGGRTFQTHQIYDKKYTRNSLGLPYQTKLSLDFLPWQKLMDPRIQYSTLVDNNQVVDQTTHHN